MQSTTRDFWKMIHDRQCTSVVMLCETIEDGTVSYSVVTFAHAACYYGNFYLFAGSVCPILARKW